MPATVHTCSAVGIDALVVDAEVDISFGLPVFNIVGLPEASVRESRDRVKSAVNNSGYTFPMDRVIVNLAPADIKKEGAGFDLPIAVAVLCASGVVSEKTTDRCIFVGELSLDGRIKSVRAVLPFALAAKQKGFAGILLPHENAAEAAMVPDLAVYPARHLSQVVDHLAGFSPIQPFVTDTKPHPGSLSVASLDFSDVKGQPHAKRALEIAAAGNHNILMNGPPGSGKSMLAKRMPTILPELSFAQSIDVKRVYSVMGLIEQQPPGSMAAPFRAPHHTISDAGLVGGGSNPVPGEISLAHHGVLFLDELPEFRKNVLEALRQPMEDGKVSIARAGMKASFPCDFLLIGAMNPCACGFASDPSGRCSCSVSQLQRYRAKVSGPLLDRMDIQIEVPRLEYKILRSRSDNIESSAEVKKRVTHARTIQQKRFAETGIFCNAGMGSAHIEQFCRLDSESNRMMEIAAGRFGLSARACFSILRVARTIADLERSGGIGPDHLREAIGYRSFDRMLGNR